MKLKSILGTAIWVVTGIVLVTVACAILDGIYHNGVSKGFEGGRFAEHEYEGTKGIADACYQWATVYDEKKPGNTEHVEKSCDSIMATAKSYVGNRPMEGMGDIY